MCKQLFCLHNTIEIKKLIANYLKCIIETSFSGNSLFIYFPLAGRCYQLILTTCKIVSSVVLVCLDYGMCLVFISVKNVLCLTRFCVFLCVWLELPSSAAAPSADDVSTMTSGVSTVDSASHQFQRLDSTKSQELQMQIKEMQDESQR